MGDLIKMIVSDSDNNVSFSTTIAQQIESDKYLDTDEAWLHYLQDHRSLIKQNSYKMAINETNLLTCRYRIRKFLRDNNIPDSLELVFRVVNRIANDQMFSEKNLDYVYIPSASYIEELRKMYRTLKSKVDKL